MSKEKTAFIPTQYFAVVAVLLAIMMSVLDGTIMNIALPTLAHDFDVTPSTAIWIVNALPIGHHHDTAFFRLIGRYLWI